MSKPFVAILMGSDSDLPVMEASFDILKKFDIPFEVKVTSAHRTPAATHSYVTDADKRGLCGLYLRGRYGGSLRRVQCLQQPLSR
jgi:phosphoribosylcarboxyaminoimidazole (NCAIR) mutase